jgi:RNA polymerase sigma factor (sigma-70 family)
MGLRESGHGRTCGGCSPEGGPRCGALVSRAAHGDSPGSADALSRVCEGCWHPVYRWIRRQGYTADAAEDLTQAYFTRFLEKRFVAQFRPEGGGCFRPFLFVSVRNFLSNERDRERALKRGGGVAPLSLDAPREERGAGREPAAANTPETLLEQSRTERLVGDALECLRVEQDGVARRGRFQRLYPHLVDDPDAESYRGIAADWGVGESAVRVAVHRLRRRLREILRDAPLQ